jgi:hypothetical protein
MILYLKSLSILLLLQLSNFEFRYTLKDYKIIKEINDSLKDLNKNLTNKN